jgi:hypothetical protein
MAFGLDRNECFEKKEELKGGSMVCSCTQPLKLVFAGLACALFIAWAVKAEASVTVIHCTITKESIDDRSYSPRRLSVYKFDEEDQTLNGEPARITSEHIRQQQGDPDANENSNRDTSYHVIDIDRMNGDINISARNCQNGAAEGHHPRWFCEHIHSSGTCHKPEPKCDKCEF